MSESLKPAQTLSDIYRTISPEPLRNDSQLHAFYVSELNERRGGDRMERIWLSLQRSYGAGFYRAFLTGHQGVGKSTELERLIHKSAVQFRAVRFSAARDLNPAGFKPFDVLLVMLIRLIEETKDCGGRNPSQSLLEDVERWLGKKTHILRQTSDAALDTSAEAGVSAPGLLAQVLRLGVNLKSSLKYVTAREAKVEQEETASIPELIGLVNKLLGECNAILKDTEAREWLFIGEDFDKAGIPLALTEDLFLNFGNIFRELHTHLIFTLPLSLVYSDRATQLPFAGDRIHSIVDTPVFSPDHTPDEAGRAAVAAVLDKRMASELFAEDQKTRLIVASGGNLRDLFKMVGDAADTALLRKATDGKIGAPDVSAAISDLRKEYLHRLSESIFDEQQTVPITYEAKAKRLLEIYSSGQKDLVPDAVMFSLFRARAVQEFNGEGWYGVHPLVVEILKRQEQPLPTVEGKVLGGID